MKKLIFTTFLVALFFPLLGQFQVSDTLQVLLSKIDNDDFYHFRIHSRIIEIDRIQNDTIEPKIFLKYLQDKNPHKRILAAKIIGSLHKRENVKKEVFDVAKKEKNTIVLEEVIKTLSEVKIPNADQFIEKLYFKSNQTKIKEAAIRYLGETKKEKFLSTILDASKLDNRLIISAAAGALSKIQTKESFDRLIEIFLDHKTQGKKYSLIRYLSKFENDDTCQFFLELLQNEKDEDLHGSLIRNMKFCKSEQVINELIKISYSENKNLEIDAKAMLQRIAPSKLLKIEIENWKENPDELRWIGDVWGQKTCCGDYENTIDSFKKEELVKFATLISKLTTKLENQYEVSFDQLQIIYQFEDCFFISASTKYGFSEFLLYPKNELCSYLWTTHH